LTPKRVVLKLAESKDKSIT